MYYTNNPPAAAPKVRLSSSSCLSPFLSPSVSCLLTHCSMTTGDDQLRTCSSPLRRKPAAGNSLLEPQPKSWRVSVLCHMPQSSSASQAGQVSSIVLLRKLTPLPLSHTHTSKWTLTLQRSGWKYWYTHSPLIPEIFFISSRRCLKFDRNPAKGESEKTSRNRGVGLSEGGQVCKGTQGFLGFTRPALAFEALGLLSLKE